MKRALAFRPWVPAASEARVATVSAGVVGRAASAVLAEIDRLVGPDSGLAG